MFYIFVHVHGLNSFVAELKKKTSLKEGVAN